jgi:hypothetical protein
MSSRDRIRDNTASHVQQAIDRATEDAVLASAQRGRLDARIEEVDREWDAERVLFTASGLNVLFGLAMGTWVNPKWYAWSAAVGAFQFQHGAQGWCPPMALIRRAKVRSRREIDTERTALKALRGDFDGIDSGTDVTSGTMALAVSAK